eukprot:336286_1
MTHIVPSIFDTHTILANKRAAQNTILYLTYTLSNDIDSHCTVDPSTDPSSPINDHNHCTVDPSIDPFIDPSNTVLLTTLIHPVVGSNAKAHIDPCIASDPTKNRIRLQDPLFGRIAISQPLKTLVCRRRPIIKMLLTEPSTPPILKDASNHARISFSNLSHNAGSRALICIRTLPQIGRSRLPIVGLDYNPNLSSKVGSRAFIYTLIPPNLSHTADSRAFICTLY